MSKRRAWPFLALYVLSGAVQPLLMWELRAAGLGDTRCQVYMVPYYLGMCCTWLLSCGSSVSWWPCLVACFGITAQSLNWAGNMRAGSSIFAVVYSSVTVWSALLSRVLLERRLSRRQWLGVVLVVSGLAFTGLDASHLGPDVLLGSAMIATGTVLHATCHTLSEMLSVRGERIPPHVNAGVQGLTGCTVLGLWQLTFTRSHWERITEPMAQAGTSWAFALWLLAFLALSNFVHAGSFFQLLTQVGVVSTGVAKALQGVLVFVFSHLFYCRHDASQCFSPIKGLSMVVVLGGVLIYVMATRPPPKLLPSQDPRQGTGTP